MESEVDIKKKFDRALAQALASPLPKLKYRGPIKRSALSIGSKTTPKPTVLSPKTSTTHNIWTGKLHQSFKQPSSSGGALKRQLSSSKTSVDDKDLHRTLKSRLSSSETSVADKDLHGSLSLSETSLVDKNSTDDYVSHNNSNKNKALPIKAITSKLKKVRSSVINNAQNQKEVGSSLVSLNRSSTSGVDCDSTSGVDSDEISGDGKERLLEAEEVTPHHPQVSPSKQHDAEEDNDLQSSGHVSRPHKDDDDEEEEDEVSSLIHEEEEFFMHKPRPGRCTNGSVKIRRLNLDGLWSGIILRKTSVGKTHFMCNKHPQRFLNRNLQDGRCFFAKYLSQMKLLESNQPKLTSAHDIPVFQDKDKPDGTKHKRGQKRKSVSQVTPKSNKKTRAKSQSDQNKTDGKNAGVKVSSRRGQGVKKNESKVASKGRSLRSDKKTTNKSQTSVPGTSRKSEKQTNKSQKLKGKKSVSKSASSRTSSASRASKKSSSRWPGGADEDREEEDEIVFFDADDEGQKSFQMDKIKVIGKRTRKNATSGVTPQGKGIQVNKRTLGSVTNTPSEKETNTPPGRKSRTKVNRTKWSEPHMSKPVTLNVMPLSCLTSTSSVTNSGTETGAASDSSRVDVDDPLVAASVRENWGVGIRPLFSSFGGRTHCGSIWKSILDEGNS
ncbi:uncharacterized protein [Amphiura filiformis]|uniref:uncharacterized protein n=1 Tax=Amphiura filiformis TaxID=82378 RepID=UPI003B212C0C